MFSDELEKISWEETTKAIYSKTEADVIRALGKPRCDVDDFMALISPAAEKYLEPMARLSKKYTEERFGRTISMFIPLYITNSCTNSCVYCGFHISNPMARTILTPEEIENEYKAIKKLAPFENLLIVTGENPAKAGVVADKLTELLDRREGAVAHRSAIQKDDLQWLIHRFPPPPDWAYDPICAECHSWRGTPRR